MKNKITKKSSIRDVLQILGTDLLRKGFNNNIHVAATLGSIKKDEKVIITDTRFENELKAVEDKQGITIRINRKPWINVDEYEVATDKKVERVVEHESETALDNAEFDYTIDNDGTLLELVGKVREILIEQKILKNE